MIRIPQSSIGSKRRRLKLLENQKERADNVLKTGERLLARVKSTEAYCESPLTPFESTLMGAVLNEKLDIVTPR